MRKLLLCCFALAMASPALAQTTFVNPTYGGGYTIMQPGGPTTFVNPTYGGGYTAITPGQPTTFINPTYGGGYTINTPGAPRPYGGYGMYGR
jgi:hypothetical protein